MTPESAEFVQFEEVVKASIMAVGRKRYPHTLTAHECRGVADLLWRRYGDPRKITNARLRWAWRVVKK